MFYLDKRHLFFLALLAGLHFTIQLFRYRTLYHFPSLQCGTLCLIKYLLGRINIQIRYNSDKNQNNCVFLSVPDLAILGEHHIGIN
jgi:hypothetical protein